MKNLDIMFDLLCYEGPLTNDPADVVRVKNRIQENDMTSISRQQLQIADLTVDSVITLPDPSSDYLIILTDRDISVKLNGWSTPMTLKTRSNGKRTVVYYSKSPVTGLSISNSSGATANVDIVFANK